MQVSIVPRGKAALGYSQSLPRDVALHTEDQLSDTMVMALGGRAAEQVLSNDLQRSPTISDDLQRSPTISNDLQRPNTHTSHLTPHTSHLIPHTSPSPTPSPAPSHLTLTLTPHNLTSHISPLTLTLTEQVVFDVVSSGAQNLNIT